MVALMMALCYNGNGILKTRKLINVQGLDVERKTPHKKRGRRGKIVENMLIFRNFFHTKRRVIDRRGCFVF